MGYASFGLDISFLFNKKIQSKGLGGLISKKKQFHVTNLTKEWQMYINLIILKNMR